MAGRGFFVSQANSALERGRQVRLDLGQQAAEALGEIGAPAKDAVPALNLLLKDKNKDVRKYAAEALSKIQSK